MLQVHRLEGFYWVGRTGGYSRAARAFPYPITQPAVHQQVKKLEAELGVELFERVAKDRVQLTAAGRALFAFAAPFFDRLPSVVRALQGGAYGGELVVYAQPLLLRHLLPAWLKRLRRRRPELRVDLHEMLHDCAEPLVAGRADLLVGYVPDPPAEVATLQVATLRPFLVLPRDHPLARRRRVQLADLDGETFISYTPGSHQHALQSEALREHGARPARSLSAGSTDTILGFVESGLGFSLVPSLHADGPKARGLAARPLAYPKVDFPVVAAWRKDTPENPLLDAALECAPRP